MTLTERASRNRTNPFPMQDRISVPRERYYDREFFELARIHRRIEADNSRASAKSAFLQGKMVVTTHTTTPTERHFFDARILPQS